MRTSTAALAAAITTITPAAALAASQSDNQSTTTGKAAKLRPALAGHPSVADQMRDFARHRHLVRTHHRLAAELAKLRGEKVDRAREQRVRRWSDARLRRDNAHLRKRIRALRAEAARSSSVSSTATGSSSYSSSAAGGAGGQLAAIRACESGGDYSTNTGNGFYGAYQFTQQTWESVGGSGNPAAASPAEQDARAAALLAQSGSSPWPVCGG